MTDATSAALPGTVSTADPRRWKALGVLLLVQFMLILDVSVVNIALPSIQGDLGFSRQGLTWVVDSYVLMAGSLLLLGGRLGDVLGRRRMFLAGVVVFGLASIACGLAQNPGTLVGARFAQGAGEALAAPAAFGLIALLFTDSRERAKAIGLFGGISGIAGTSGPILSGALVEYASWRWIFLLNIPVALVALAVVPRLVSADAARAPGSRRHLDLTGAALSTLGLTGIVFGLIEAASEPWSSTAVLLPLLGGLVLVGVFVASQTRARTPLLPLRFLRERTRVTANLVALLFFSLFFSQFFITTLYLQEVLGFSALRTGLGFLPFGIAVGASLGLATNLIPKVGIRPVLVTGLLVAAAGTLLFTRIEADGSYLTQVLPASVVIALGSGFCLPALGNAAVHRVTDEDAGLASGLQQALQQIGGAVGLAVLVTLALRRAADAIGAGADPAAAITDGYVLALRVGAVVVLLAAAFAAVLMGREAGKGERVAAAH
ncbi:MAG: DHA2 family efflux MFS transporter permease subunit [Frankiaceae bacterium]|nr:DHA2 family efflux MFS transporter permease subunit [Frankiaceae bacterium]